MNYLEDIYILSHIKRYSTVHTLRTESVAEHSFNVAAILFRLHEDYEFNLPEAVTMAIVHDMPEMELNDVPRIIKQRYPLIKDAFRACELDVIDELPMPVRAYLQTYEQMDTVEAKMVKFADVIQCKQYAHTEMKLGNHGYMEDVYHASLKRINEMKEELKHHERR